MLLADVGVLAKPGTEMLYTLLLLWCTAAWYTAISQALADVLVSIKLDLVLYDAGVVVNTCAVAAVLYCCCCMVYRCCAGAARCAGVFQTRPGAV